MEKIKTLNIKNFSDATADGRSGFVNELGLALEEIGFVIITGHSLSADQQRKAYEKIDQFFKLPADVKRSYEMKGSGGARGYTSFGKEHAKDSPIGDLKEFFHVGVEVPPEHPLENAYPKNVSVKEIPGFDSALRDLYKSLLELGMEMLQAIALHLKLDENFFLEKVRYGNSILRPIHYPPLTGQELEGAVRSSAHEDINLITLLIGASSPGLEVKSRRGEWISVTTEPSEIVVNVGDMLQRLSNHKLVSTTHRVVNPPKHSRLNQASTRYSIPFFLHPIAEMSLAALPSCTAQENPARESPTTAGAYLEQRLREIGLL